MSENVMTRLASAVGFIFLCFPWFMAIGLWRRYSHDWTFIAAVFCIGVAYVAVQLALAYHVLTGKSLLDE